MDTEINDNVELDADLDPFMSGPDDVAGIGDVSTEAAPVVEQAQEVEQAEEPKVSQSTSAVDPDAIAAAVAKGIQQAQPKQAAQAEPEWTEADIDKYLKRAKYSVDDLKAFGLVTDDMSAEEAQQKVQIFSEIQQRSVQEAIATAQVMLQHERQQMEQQYNPILQEHVRQQQQGLVDQFYGAYPDLKPYEDLVKLATTQIQASGSLEGKDLKTAMTLVATASADLIAKYGGKQINLTATQKSPKVQQASTTHSRVPTPAGSTTGGRSQQASQPAGAPDEFDIYNRT